MPSAILRPSEVLRLSEILKPFEVLKLPSVLISYAAMGTGESVSAEGIHNQYIHIPE